MKETTILITPKQLLAHPPAVKFPELKSPRKDTIIDCLGRYGTGRTPLSDQTVADIQRGNGRWLICSCKEWTDGPPTLFFRSNYLVRHHRSPEHHIDCAFYRSLKEQNSTLTSYAKPIRKRLSLLQKFRDRPALVHDPEAVRGEGKWRRRSTLARLLCTLLTKAEIQTTVARAYRPMLERQIELVANAAEEFLVDDSVTLKQVLCTDPAEFESFKSRIGSDELPWIDNARRQGVFIFHVDRVEDRMIFPIVECPAIPITDRIAVYGEMTPDDGEPDDPVDVRAPYLCIGVVGQRAEGGPIEAISCYLHPSYKATDMMLVDSILERKTFNQIISTALTLRSEKIEVEIAVEKPLFDVSPETVNAEDSENKTGPSRPVLIPDFILRVAGNDCINETIVIETLGFRSPTYRDRKSLLVPMMCEALGAVEVEYDRYDDSENEVERHRRFRDRLREKISGQF